MPKPTRYTWTTKAGKVRAAWQVRYTDRSGRRRAQQFNTKPEAAEFAATVTSGVRAGTHVHDRDTVTIGEAAENWLAACTRGRNGREPCEPWTVAVYEQFVRLHIRPAIGGMMLNTLTPSRVREFRDVDMLGAGKSRYLTRKVLTALSAICADAVADELLGVNPCAGIRLISNKRQKDEVTIPSKDQVRAIMEVAQRWADGNSPLLVQGKNGPMLFKQRVTKWRGIWWCTFLRFLITTGCRSSEVRGAPWGNFADRQFSVRQRADNTGRIGPPKSAAGWRDLDLDDGMLDALERWRPICPKSKLDLIFPSGKGNPQSLSNISKRYWFPMLIDAGIATIVRENGKERHEAPFSIHDLRHFHASLLIEAGMEAKALQVHMGHSSIKVTMDVYGHLFKDEETNARRRRVVTGATSALLSGPKPKAKRAVAQRPKRTPKRATPDGRQMRGKNGS